LTSSEEISVYVTDYNDCQSSAHKTMTVLGNPDLTMDNQYVCEGKDLTIYTGGSYAQYLWYNAKTTSSINLEDVQAPVTNAWVKVTDANGCSTVADFEIQLFDLNQIYFEPIDICKGESKTLTAPSGFDSYVWNTGETTRVIEVTPSSDFTYTCTVVDGSCEQRIDFEVRVNESTPFTLENVYACKGENTTVNGPSGYGSYAWNYGAATSKDLIFKTNTDFTLSLTAWQDGCPHTASAQVVVIEAEKFDLTDKPICSGSSISYTAPSGYQYDWSDNSQDGNQTGTFSPVETTTYSLTIEDAYGCQSSDDFTITVNDFIDFNIPDKEICRGTTTELSVQPIYSTILWSTGETTSSIEVAPLNSASYSVTVTDYNGCQGTATSEVSVMDNLAISLENKEICLGEFVTIGLENSVEFHSYSWNNGSTQSTQDVSPNTNTVYSLTVEDENGCEATASMQVNVFTPQEITISPVTVCQGEEAQLTAPNGLTEHTWNGVQTNEDVFSLANIQYNSVVNFRAKDNNGCLTYASTSVLVNRNPVVNISDKYMCKFEASQVYITEGFSSYAWSTGSTESYTDIYALEDENISVTVTDANGCQTTESFDLTVYDYTTIDLPNQSICEGENAIIGIEGDWTSYIWSNGKTSQQITESPYITTDYMVSATDLHGCKSTASMTVTVNKAIDYELPTIELCEGGITTVTADPGMQSYLWHTGETTQSIDFTPNENELVTLTYTDQNGCQGTAKKIAVVYKKPEIFLDNYDVCLGNTKEIVAPGGYTYLWNNGSISRKINVTPTTSTSYTLIATDAYGCRDTATTLVTVRNNPAVSLPGYTLCPGEILNLDGGEGYNSYYWSNGVVGRYNTVKPIIDTDYNLTVTDIYGCNATATSSVIVHEIDELELDDIEVCRGDTTEILAQNGFDTYLWTTGYTGRNLSGVLSDYNKIGLTVTDGNNCKQYEEKIVTVLDKPDFFFANEYVACQGQSVNVSIVPGYLVYRWSDGSFLNNRTFWPTGSSDLSLEVEHLNGCRTKKYTTIRESNFSDNYLEDVLACHNEIVEFSLKNSESISSVVWSTGETGDPSIYVLAEKDSIISAEITDIYGCEGEVNAQLFLQSTVSPKLKDITLCKGEQTTVYPSGVYKSYLWSTGETTSSITVIGDMDRTISLEVQDEYGCTYNSSFDITIMDMPDINLTDFHLCYTDTIALGVPSIEGFSYLWNTGETTNVIRKFVNSDKEFILTLIDNENGCRISDTATIKVYPEPETDINSQFANKGDIIILSLDNSYKNVNWSTGESTNSITLVADTTEYLYVQATDENSCQIREEVFIYVSGPETNMVVSDTACQGEACLITARSGYAQYKWSTGETSNYIVTYDNEDKQYTVDITDHGGTINTFSTKSKIKQGPSINFGDTSLCYGDDLTLRLSAGEANYLWSNGETSSSVTFENILKNFEFTVMVEGVNGCKNEKSGLVTIRQNNHAIIGLKDHYEVGEKLNISISEPATLLTCLFYINGVEYNSTSVQTELYNEGENEIKVVLQENNGCYFEETKTFVVGEKIGISKNNDDQWIFLFPNPVEELLNIQVGDFQNGYDILVYDAMGKKVLNEIKNTSDIYEYNMDEYPEGVYVIVIITKQHTYTKRIFKK
jgi:hypothetical protein